MAYINSALNLVLTNSRVDADGGPEISFWSRALEKIDIITQLLVVVTTS